MVTPKAAMSVQTPLGGGSGLPGQGNCTAAACSSQESSCESVLHWNWYLGGETWKRTGEAPGMNGQGKPVFLPAEVL